MQITLNHSEVESIIAAHIVSVMPSIEPEEVIAVIINEDGSASIGIGEGVGTDNDTPPVVTEDKPVQRRRRRSNPAEARHVPVDAVKEPEQPVQTSTGGQNGSSTQEVKEPTEIEQLQPTEKLKEKATEQAESAAAQVVTEQTEIKPDVQEEKAVEAPAAKPSLFANLKR